MGLFAIPRPDARVAARATLRVRGSFCIHAVAPELLVALCLRWSAGGWIGEVRDVEAVAAKWLMSPLPAGAEGSPRCPGDAYKLPRP